MPMLRNNNNINSYCPTTKTIELNTSKNPRVRKSEPTKKEWWEGGKTAGAKSQELRTQDSGVTTLCPCRPWPTPSEVNTLIIQHLEFVKCEYKHERK